MSDYIDEDTEGTQVISSKRVLIIELQMILWPGVRRTFDLIGSILKKRGIALDVVGFTRYFLGKPFRRGFREILISEDKEGDLDKMMEEVSEGIDTTLSITDGMADFKRVFEAAEEKEMGLCFISHLEEDGTNAMITALGMNPEELTVVAANRDLACTTPADVWKRALRETLGYPRLSLGIVSSSGSSRGALAAGVRVAAVTSEYTSCGDFSGADVVIDDYSDASIDELIELIGRD